MLVRGSGMFDYVEARRIMVDRQVRTADVTDLRIIAAMLDVPRERFAPGREAIAYLDVDLPVAGAQAGRALLKPMVFAKLVQAAEIGPADHVLDLGCATGYSAAVLSRLCGSVVALEEDAGLAKIAQGLLAASGSPNVTVAIGPLAAGWDKGAPYDAVVVEGSCEVMPQALARQLKEGGRLVAVAGAAPMGKATVYRAIGGHLTAQALFDAAAPALPGFARPPAFVF
jgi:protein-L-isoaspartate(D-aspartate) O-methyltransferase